MLTDRAICHWNERGIRICLLQTAESSFGTPISSRRSWHQYRLPWVYHQERIIWSRACAQYWYRGWIQRENNLIQDLPISIDGDQLNLHMRGIGALSSISLSIEFPASEFDSVRGASSPPSKWENLLCSLCADTHHHCLRVRALKALLAGMSSLTWHFWIRPDLKEVIGMLKMLALNV